MDEWTPLRVAWDCWRATRDGPAAITARQQARLAGLVTFARTHSPYYAEKYQGLPIQIGDLQQLPLVNKQDLMAHFDDWVTDPAVTRAGLATFIADKAQIGRRYLDRYMIYTTSGSSGTPAILVHDPGSVAVMNGLAYGRGLIMAMLGWRELWRLLRGGARQAAVFATGGHFLGASMFARRLLDRPIRTRMARLFSALDPLPDLVRELNTFQPALLGGYASALMLLAREQEAGRLHIHPVLITSSGETLSPTERKRIVSALGGRLMNVYSTSEAPGVTFECKRRRMHLNADWFILEPIDAAGRPVPPGRLSYSTLLTNLANRVQPIVRYELGDSIVVSPDPCPCGSPLPVIRVIGRTDEILAFPAADGRPVHLLPLALGTVIEETPGVRRFQAIQTGPETLSVRLEATNPAEAGAVWAEVAGRLRAYLAQQDLAAVTIERASEPPAPDPLSGKFRQVWVARSAGAAPPSLAPAPAVPPAVPASV